MEDSYIERFEHGTVFVGRDATLLYQAMATKHAIDLYLKTGLKMSRVATPSRMLSGVSGLTHKKYPRGRSGLVSASADLTQWIEAMKSAIPVKEDNANGEDH